MNHLEIEAKARALQKQVWERNPDMPLNTVDDLKRLFAPSSVAEALGINYQEEETLGKFGFRGDAFEVAGLINRSDRLILVSRAFPAEVRRFTGAHEIGHWLLHSGAEMHRDRPVKGLTLRHGRAPEEYEADYFAACLLMPRKIITQVFHENFGPTPFIFDDASAFALGGSNYGALLRPTEDSLARELALASSETYCGRHFHSLAKQFGVSTQSMAIRLKELQLIRA